ncbi:MAG: transporter substrate-binding protein [Betaproteobacteria bacterium]|nr:transporter substrate-binding protein [Betaproteobacteria bacterium]
MRRTYIFFAAVLTTGAFAQDYPLKPIRMVVTGGAGGSTDVVARIVGDKLGAALGQPIVYDNRPGASGIIAAEISAKSPPDGYTMYVGTTGGLAINVSLYKKLPYDPARDFAPVSLVGTQPYMLVVHPSLPARNVKELIALAKKTPGQISFSHTGVGSATHLAGALLEGDTGVTFLSVPYKSPAHFTAVISGEVSFTITSVYLSWTQVQAGKLRALAVTGKQRSAIAPNVPTMAESGIANYEMGNWYGFLMPAATPAAIVNLVNAKTLEALKRPDIRAALAKSEIDPVGSSPQEFGKFIAGETAKYAALIRQVGIKPE